MFIIVVLVGLSYSLKIACNFKLQHDSSSRHLSLNCATVLYLATKIGSRSGFSLKTHSLTYIVRFCSRHADDVVMTLLFTRCVVCFVYEQHINQQQQKNTIIEYTRHSHIQTHIQLVLRLNSILGNMLIFDYCC